MHLVVDKVNKVTDYIYRGPRPPNAAAYDGLKAQNVQYLLNCERGWLDWWTGRVNYEAKSALSRGMLPIHIQMSPLVMPNAEAVSAGLALMHRATVRRFKMYLHCKDGVDRTGIMCAAERVVVEGWPMQKAVDEMLEMGFHRYRYAHWIPRMPKLFDEVRRINGTTRTNK